MKTGALSRKRVFVLLFGLNEALPVDRKSFDGGGTDMNRFCQSCGMPMKKDPQKGGTRADGTRNADYCSYCYRDGAFTSPEIRTAADMQRFCIGKLKQMGTPGFMAWLLTRSIPKLKRWRSA